MLGLRGFIKSHLDKFRKKKYCWKRKVKMGSLAPELGLDLKLIAKRIIGYFMKDEFPLGGASNLKNLLGRLEEEQRKIDAFKRELPLCMNLINVVIDELKLETEQCPDNGCLLEVFMTARAYEDEKEREAVKSEKECNDKIEWMSSAQLWNYNCSDESVGCKKNSQEKRNGETLALESGSKYAGIADLMPFNLDSMLPWKREEQLSISSPNLSLFPPEIKCDAGNNLYSGPGSKTTASAQAPTPTTLDGSAHVGLQGQKKTRRCWSPELHRRFICALQQLGGAQVATPKLIRELMSVDGLTNDEVKSHLQKYRLHTRRMLNSSSTQMNKSLSIDEDLH